MKNIIAIVDFSIDSVKALNTAVNICNQFGSTLHLISIKPQLEVINAVKENHKLRQIINGSISNGKHDLVASLLKKLMQSYVPEHVQGEILSKDEKNHVRNINYELIISGADIYKGMHDPYHKELAGANNIPVLLMKDGFDKSLNTLLVSTDLGNSLPENIFDFCQSLYDQQVTIHYAHILKANYSISEGSSIDLQNLRTISGERQSGLHIVGSKNQLEELHQVARKIEADYILYKLTDKCHFWIMTTAYDLERYVIEGHAHQKYPFNSN